MDEEKIVNFGVAWKFPRPRVFEVSELVKGHDLAWPMKQNVQEVGQDVNSEWEVQVGGVWEGDRPMKCDLISI